MTPPGDFSPTTRLCAVIGNPVGHSLSPALHNAAFRALGLDYVYLAFRVEDLAGATAGMRALENFRGLSVTIPHKIAIIPLLDEISPLDRAIGSVNTVINEGGRLVGLGTDGPGALKALRDAGVTVDGASVLMLGAGGAARAIAFTLAGEASPAGITLLDLDRTLLQGLADDLGRSTATPVRSGGFDEATLADAMARADIVINCTPVGMSTHVDRTLVPARLLRPGQTVFDIVYTPLETRLLADAAAAGCRTVSGVEMFINQAALQFERFTGCTAPVDIMRQVVMERLVS
jgi:shikimate dehydrogenase